MKSFKLTIITPEREKFSGEAESLIVRTTEGDVQILAGHASYFAALGTGRVKLQLPGGETKVASASGGILSVGDKEVTLLPATFEFSGEIDLARAVRAKEKAEKLLASAKEEREINHAKLKLMRALSRISVADNKR